MTHYHPSDNELAEYAAGTADWAVAICVGAHLHYCPACKAKVLAYSEIGGQCLSQNEAIPVEDSALSNTLAKIRSVKNSTKEETFSTSLAAPQKENTVFDQLPKVLKKLIQDPKKIKWKRVSPSLREAHLVAGQDQYEVCLHKISKGKKVAQHDHGGTEIVVVLNGAFSDHNGTYREGDFVTKHPGEIHRPAATEDKDCLCLSVVSAPVKVSGLLGKAVNPFIQFNPK